MSALGWCLRGCPLSLRCSLIKSLAKFFRKPLVNQKRVEFERGRRKIHSCTQKILKASKYTIGNPAPVRGYSGFTITRYYW